MSRLITIINPGKKSALFKRALKDTKKGERKMAVKRKKARKKVKKVARKKGAKKRRNYSAFKNPRRKRVFSARHLRGIFTRSRIMRGFALILGIGISGLAKGLTANMFPTATDASGAVTESFVGHWYKRLYGILSVVVGASLNMRGKRVAVKNAGTGMVAYGVYDLLVSNVPMLAAYLPTISPPAFLSGGMSYGRSLYGASITSGPVEVVGGANINSNMTPEIVGQDSDLAEALEMAA